jgi:hypothetical protein
MPAPVPLRPRVDLLAIATFPAFAVHYNSPSAYETDLRVERSIDGTGRGRAFYLTAKRTIDVKLPAITQDERDILISFFNANMAEPFAFPVDCPPVLMSVVFLGAPTVTPLGAGWFEASFRVTQFP